MCQLKAPVPLVLSTCSAVPSSAGRVKEKSAVTAAFDLSVVVFAVPSLSVSTKSTPESIVRFPDILSPDLLTFNAIFVAFVLISDAFVVNCVCALLDRVFIY